MPVLAFFSLSDSLATNQLKHIKPESVIFCWDIHGTLLSRDRGHISMVLKTMWHLLRSKTARHICHNHLNQKGHCGGECLEHQYRQLANEYIADADFVLVHGHKALAQRLLEKAHNAFVESQKQINTPMKKQYENKAHWYQKRATQALKGKDKNLAKKYHHKAKRCLKLAHLFHNFELNYKNKKGVPELLQALKYRGYRHHYVASNIGIKHYQFIKEKFPAIFNDNMVKDGLTVNAWQEPIVKKPSYAYFNKLQAMYNPNNDKVLVFIDDLQKNVDAANQCGLIGIRTKDVHYLVKQLNKEGLNLTYNKQNIHSNGQNTKKISIV